jgi:hypothetical protein
MATEAQQAANRRNAQHSTGPRTPEGKARAAANATTLGLFTAANLVEPEDQPAYEAFTEAFRTQLAPEGAIEDTLAIEVIAAAWRLRRCGIIESNLHHCDDPDATQTALDRARNQAHRLYIKGLAELRRLQTERQLPRHRPRPQNPHQLPTRKGASQRPRHHREPDRKPRTTTLPA